jgi:hypothetical protein
MTLPGIQVDSERGGSSVLSAVISTMGLDEVKAVVEKDRKTLLEQNYGNHTIMNRAYRSGKPDIIKYVLDETKKSGGKIWAKSCMEDIIGIMHREWPHAPGYTLEGDWKKIQNGFLPACAGKEYDPEYDTFFNSLKKCQAEVTENAKHKRSHPPNVTLYSRYTECKKVYDKKMADVDKVSDFLHKVYRDNYPSS